MNRAAWAAGAPLRGASIALIRAYRMTLSGMLGGQCRFYPSCSHYAEDAIRNHGFVKGWALASWRVLRCNPFGKGGLEPAPPAHDGVTPHRGRERAA
jgi:putative membrane protein insertion efficiency factor